MSKHAPGPWVWSVNKKSHHVTLTGKSGWGHTVMDFVRYGMNSAAPRFNVDGLMYRADALASVISGEEHHSEWNMDINHPDALLIEAAPDLLEALKGAEMALRNVGVFILADKYKEIIARAEGETK